MKSYIKEKQNKLFLVFIIGGILLSFLWRIQELILNHDTSILTYILPFFFGGLTSIFVYYLYDLQNRKEIELKENRYKKLFNNIDNAVAIFKPINNGENFRLVDVNFKAQSLEERSKKEVMGKKFKELSENREFSELYSIFKRVYKTGKPEEYFLEINKDEDLEMYQRNYIYKLKSGEIVNIYEDLTKLKNKEKTLKSKNELLEGLMDNLLVGVAVVNQDGNIAHLNKGFNSITGYDEKDINSLEDWFLRAFPNQANRKKAKIIWEKGLESKQAVRDLEITCKDGTKKQLHFRANFMEDKHIVSLIDMTEKNKLHNQLKEKSDYLKKIISNIPEILLILDEDGYYKDIWTAKHEDLVRPSEQLKGKNVDDVLPQKVANKIKNNLKKAVNKDEVHNFEYYLNISGEERYFEAKLILLEKQSQNQKSKFLVLIDNITERVKKSSILKGTKERLELIIDATDTGIFDINFRTGNVIVNDNIHNLTGYDQYEIDRYIGFWLDRVHKEDKEKVLNKLDAHFEGETPYFNIEHRIKTKDNGIRWFRLNGNLIESNNEGDPQRVVGILQDIHEQKQMHMKLKEQKEHYEQLFGNSIEGIALLDQDARIMKINSKFQEIFGYKQAEIEGKHIDNLITPDNIKKQAKRYNKRALQNEEIKQEVVRETKEGKKINVSLHGFSVNLSDGSTGIYAVYNDITKRKQIEAKIKYLSFHDELTELYNRRFFDAELDKMNKSRRLPISIIIGDLNGLKTVNDNHGHSAGDKYLKNMATILNNVLRDEDVVARIGGDEFGIILPNTKKKAAQKVCDRINEKCEEFTENNNLDIPLEISLGFSTIFKKDESIYDCVNKADQKMYKNKGRSRRIDNSV